MCGPAPRRAMPRRGALAARSQRLMTELPRRDFLKGTAAAALAAAAGGIPAARAEPLGPAAPFPPGEVMNRARELAKAPYQPPVATLPDPFANLTFEQYSAIHRVPGSAIWNGDNAGFSLEPLHRGFVFSAPVELNLVEAGQSRRIAYDRSVFEFGKLAVPAGVPDIGFSGVRVLQGGGGNWTEAVVFQGATFFRSHARGQGYGVSARGLSIRTGDPGGEEAPGFRALWIEKPSPASGAMVIQALLDSPSLTGAFRFTIRGGDVIIIDTELTLFARARVDHLGLGAMTAIYLFGGLDRRGDDDVRPNVYEVTGLQMLTGGGEWLWRPAANRESLQVSAFLDKNPRGFGLLQRNRDFERFGDDVAHWELEPSLWIEPIGDWGEGEVVLFEIPSASESNDNVIAQWRPKAGLGPGESVSYAYRQFWCWAPPARPEGASATYARMGKLGKLRRFAVEFVSEAFADPRKGAAAIPMVSASLGRIVVSHAYPYKDRRSVRVVFDFDPGSETSSELRMVLVTDEKPVSETWLYRWTA
jgi:glucans biosynthesis protein